MAASSSVQTFITQLLQNIDCCSRTYAIILFNYVCEIFQSFSVSSRMRMRIPVSLTAVSTICLCLYVLITLVILNKVLTKDKCSSFSSFPGCIKSYDAGEVNLVLDAQGAVPSSLQSGFVSSDHKQIEIWSKAAIGWYLWNSVFNARLEPKPGEPWSVGTRRFPHYTFTFRAGPGVVPNTVPADVQYLVLVLNGHTKEKADAARAWLDLLSSLVLLRGVAVVLHGNETGHNNWIRPYLRMHGGPVDALFVVYDDPTVDDRDVFQWPLGVATYRGFPQGPYTVDVNSPRSWTCNFFGTVYANSSRETLRDSLLSMSDHNCLLKTRQQWTGDETQLSAQQYVDALLQSDLTLSPAGQHAECYRLYEAAALGSVPVLTEPPPAQLRLLRRHGAPFVWLSDWRRLDVLLRREAALTAQQRASRRRRLLDWYETFKRSMRNRFINVIVRKFFPRDVVGKVTGKPAV